MSLVESHYKRHFETWRHGFHLKRRNVFEGQEQKTFFTLLDSAISFFEDRRADSLDLPPTSGERALVEAALGLLRQAQSQQNPSPEQLQSSITTLRNGLQGLVEGSDTESSIYTIVKEITTNLAALYTQIATDGGVPGEGDPAPEDGAPPPEDGAAPSAPSGEEPVPEEEEDNSLSDPESLARALDLK